MRRWWSWGMMAALLLSLGLPLGSRAGSPADDDDDKPPVQRSSWRTTTVWDKLFPSDGPPRPQPPAPPARDKDSAAHKANPVEQPRVEEKPSGMGGTAAAQREREERAYLRRQAVCDKLHEIAEQTRDEELERKVRRLDERIWAIYQEHTSRLPSSDALVNMDETILDKHLGDKTPATSVTHAIGDKDHGSQAAVQEEKP